MTRIPLVEDVDLPPANIFAALGHRSDLLERYREYGGRLVTAGAIEPRPTELIVVATAAALGSDYLWSHHGDLARSHGVTDDELRAIREDKLDAFADRERACIAMARKVERRAVTDDDIAELADLGLAPGEIVELVLLTTFYGMTARVLDALDVPLEAGRTGLGEP